MRALHFQVPPRPQAKLIRVLRGSIHDVAVDLRVGSPNYGAWVAERLTAEGGEQLFVPHGFCTLEPDTEVAYKVDDYYAPECHRCQPHDARARLAAARDVRQRTAQDGRMVSCELAVVAAYPRPRLWRRAPRSADVILVFGGNGHARKSASG